MHFTVAASPDFFLCLSRLPQPRTDRHRLVSRAAHHGHAQGDACEYDEDRNLPLPKDAMAPPAGCPAKEMSGVLDLVPHLRKHKGYWHGNGWDGKAVCIPEDTRVNGNLAAHALTVRMTPGI